MAETLKQTEAIPATYPASPAGLSTEAAALPAQPLWQRIEAYVSQRWTPRVVTWMVEGPGDWTPPLTPATITVSEVWIGGVWSAVTLQAAPDGYCLPDNGPYRISANVGSGTVPAGVNEAFRRLAEYSVTIGRGGGERPGSSANNYDVGPVKISFERAPTWIARALINSGAADLLRPYRRAS